MMLLISQEWLAMLGGIGFASFLATLGFISLHLQKKERRQKEQQGAATREALPPAPDARR